jgi:hypothetical protein
MGFPTGSNGTGCSGGSGFPVAGSVGVVGVGVGTGLFGSCGLGSGVVGVPGSCGGGTGLPLGFIEGGGLSGGTSTLVAGFFFFLAAQPSTKLPIKNKLRNNGSNRNIKHSTATRGLDRCKIFRQFLRLIILRVILP